MENASGVRVDAHDKANLLRGQTIRAFGSPDYMSVWQAAAANCQMTGRCVTLEGEINSVRLDREDGE